VKRILNISIVVLIGLFLVSSLVFAADKTSLGTAIRSLENPYHADWAAGGEMFAKSVGYPQVIQTCEGSSEKQFNDIKALVAKTGGNVVFCVDPNESPNCVPIAKALEEAGVYFVTFWNKPDDLKVMDYPHWVSHITFDGVAAGQYIATELFKTFKTPNKGKIVAVRGLLANAADIERWEGLALALKSNPDVEMVAYEAADWDRAKAFEKISNMLVAHPDIDGVFAANDNMAMGAIEALRAAGLAGKVKVVGVDGIEEMLRAIAKGEAAATCLPDPKWQGGIGLSIALAAKEGRINVSSLPKEKRQFYATMVNINADNIDKIIKTYLEGTPEFDWTDYWGRWLRGIE